MSQEDIVISNNSGTLKALDHPPPTAYPSKGGEFESFSLIPLPWRGGRLCLTGWCYLLPLNQNQTRRVSLISPTLRVTFNHLERIARSEIPATAAKLSQSLGLTGINDLAHGCLGFAVGITPINRRSHHFF